MNARTGISRRDCIRLSAGAMLSLGLWPGRLRAADNGKGGEVTFVVANDVHYHSAKCPAWCERVTASIRSQHPVPQLCLLVGDLAEHGNQTELGAMRDVLRSLQIPAYCVIGNHDYASDNDRKAWEDLFPESLNYSFEHSGWQFVGLDTTEGTHYEKTHIPTTTLRWLGDKVPKLDRDAPTVVFTHFPMGAGVSMRPLNADDLLELLKDLNLVAVFDGHFHGFTEKHLGKTLLTTNKCCSISRSNHDGTMEKGYFLCAAKSGTIRRQFVEVRPG